MAITYLIVGGSDWSSYIKNDLLERMLYEMLYGFEDTDDFWEEEIGGYSKDVCFRDYSNYIENRDGSIEMVKAWFASQKEYAERGYSKFIGRWKQDNTAYIKGFQDDFIRAYNYVTGKIGATRYNE